MPWGRESAAVCTRDNEPESLFKFVLYRASVRSAMGTEQCAYNSCDFISTSSGEECAPAVVGLTSVLSESSSRGLGRIRNLNRIGFRDDPTLVKKRRLGTSIIDFRL